MILKNITEQIDAANAALKKLDLEKPPIRNNDAYIAWCNKVGAARHQIENAVGGIVGFYP